MNSFLKEHKEKRNIKLKTFLYNSTWIFDKHRGMPLVLQTVHFIFEMKPEILARESFNLYY